MRNRFKPDCSKNLLIQNWSSESPSQCRSPHSVLKSFFIFDSHLKCLFFSMGIWAKAFLNKTHKLIYICCFLHRFGIERWEFVPIPYFYSATYEWHWNFTWKNINSPHCQSLGNHSGNNSSMLFKIQVFMVNMKFHLFRPK